MNPKQAAVFPLRLDPLSWLSPTALFLVTSALLSLLLGIDDIRTDLVEGWHDPDSLLRIVQVRDFLDGQGWYDLTMTRMAPPDGVFMHWSRLVDLPMAMIVWILEPFVGRTAAEVVMANLWPPLLFVVFAGGLAAIAHRFAGWQAVAWSLLLVLFAPTVTGIFTPARLDHHNVQAVLVVWLVAALVRADRGWRPGAAAGAIAGLSLAVGMEMLLVIVVAAGGLSVAWMLTGDRMRRGLAGFGLGFAGAVAAAFLAGVAPGRWLLPLCDSLSIFYLALALCGGFGVAALAAVIGRGHGTGATDVVVRGSALVGLGALVLAVAALVEPTCLAGPYAQLDPRLKPIWLDNVSEAASILDYVRDRLWQVPVHFGAPITAVALGLLMIRRFDPADRLPFALLLAIVTASTIVGSIQVRGLVPAQIVGAAIGAVLIVMARRAAEDHQGVAKLARRLVWIPLSPLALYFIFVPFSNVEAEAAETQELADVGVCMTELGRVLDTAPPGLVVAPTNLGAFILYRSREHEILAAPYHRNTAGILAADGIFTGPDDRTALQDLGATYVVLCPRDSETLLLRRRSPEGLAERLVDGRPPDYLEPIAVTDNLLAYAVRLPRRAEPAVTGSLPSMTLRPAVH